jgi:hypothetical protein
MPGPKKARGSKLGQKPTPAGMVRQRPRPFSDIRLRVGATGETGVAGTEIAQRPGHLCESRRVFDPERSRNIHRGRMKCSKSTTATAAKGMPTDKGRADLGQGEIHSAGQSPDCDENAFVQLSDSRRERIKFPPVSDDKQGERTRNRSGFHVGHTAEGLQNPRAQAGCIWGYHIPTLFPGVRYGRQR